MNKVLKSLAVISGSSISVKIIGFFTVPLIAKIYGPENIGTISVFLSILSITGALIHLNYPVAINVVRYDYQAKLLEVGSYIVFFINVVLLFLLFLFCEFLIGIDVTFNLGYYFHFIWPALLAKVYLDNSSYKISRFQAFNASSVVMIISAIFGLITKVSLGYFSASVDSLLLATLCGYVFHSFLNNQVVKANEYKLYLRRDTFKKLYLSLRFLFKERDYALYRTPQSLVYYLSDSLPLLVIGMTYSMASAGLFGVAKTIIDLPIKLFFSSFGQVITPFFSKKAHSGEDIKKLCIKVMLCGFFIMAPLFLIAYYLIPILFNILFNSEWSGAIVFAQYLLLSSFGVFVCLPAICILPIIGKQKVLYYFELIMLAVKSMVIGYVLFNMVDVNLFVYLISLINFFGYLLLYVYFILLFKSKDSRE